MAAFSRRLDRCGFVDDALVVKQDQRPWFAQSEALPVRPFGFEYAALAAANVFARHQQDGDEIHAVAMRALWRRTSDAIAGVDAELVCLHVPWALAFNVGADAGNGAQ